jgi:hypothetical protein
MSGSESSRLATIPTAQPRRWNIEETRALLGKRLQSEKYPIAPMLKAVGARLYHARYHFRESKRLLAEYIRYSCGEDGPAILAIAPQQDDGLEKYNQFFLECEAHMTASAQAIHATADILAHVIYYAFEIQNSDHRILQERNIKLSSVISAIEKALPTYPFLEAILQLLQNLRSDSSFELISNLVNHAKHRGGPSICLGIDCLDNGELLLKFGAFSKENTEYPTKNIEDVLSPSFQIINETVVDVGIAMNQALRERQSCHHD